MTIDKSWTKIPNRRSEAFIKGLKNFMEIAEKHVNEDGNVRCPCKNCANSYLYPTERVYAHINDFGFLPSYDVWVHHGEEYPASFIENILNPITNTAPPNELFDAIDDIMAEQNTNEENSDEGGSGVDEEFDALFNELNTELFPGCTWMSSLNFIAKLLHIKVNNKWTNSSFDQLLAFLKNAFPKENKIPTSYYEAKKKLKKIGLGYQSIHACENDCCLFWKEHASANLCPICKESRWVNDKTKGKKVPKKVMRYFPLTSRLKRRYGSRHTAKDMTWHKTGHSEDGIMRHPVDGSAWEEFDKRHPDFAKEPRNVRLGLAADGFNPFNTGPPYSMWPVILTTYNTPPWQCMKESSLMLTLLIPGPKSPGKDMDVFLRPLVDELKMLWHTGVQVRDASMNNVFRMHAALLWTINDFPARSSFSGWSGQGYLACPTCNKDTPSIPVINKIVYVGHRRFLKNNHPLRKDLSFDGKVEKRGPPKRFSNAELLAQLDRLPNLVSGKHVKKRKRSIAELNWTKRSIFFELEYWSSLDLKHNLDVMHVEKNVCDSVLNTLLESDKTKDTLNARRDLQNLNIREHLWLIDDTTKPKTPYTFNPTNRQCFYQFVKEVRLPDGFGSNFRKKVNENCSSFIGLKSHDCHILMQRLLPIGLRAGLDKNVSTTIINLCTFFKKICARNLVVKDMIEAQDDLIKILCNLEKLFPPAFFDIMIHLVLHLPEEAILYIRLISNEIADNIPPYYESWREVPEPDRHRIIPRLHHFFNLNRFRSQPQYYDAIQKSIENDCAKRYKERKYEYKKHFDKHGGYENPDMARKNHPSHVPSNVWGKTIDSLWLTEKFRRRSEANKDNRAKQKYPTTQGSSSMAQKRLKERVETNKEPSLIEMWKKNHCNKKKGWVNDDARLDYERLVVERDRAAASSSGTIDEAAILKKVLGEVAGYTKGVGRKIKSSSHVYEPSPMSVPPPDERTLQWLTNALMHYNHQHNQHNAMNPGPTAQPFQFHIDPSIFTNPPQQPYFDPSIFTTPSTQPYFDPSIFTNPSQQANMGSEEDDEDSDEDDEEERTETE